MVLNYIWIAFFIIAFVIAVVKLVFFGDFDVFPAMMDSTFSSSKTAFEYLVEIGLGHLLHAVVKAEQVVGGLPRVVIPRPLRKDRCYQYMEGIAGPLWVQSFG